MAAARTDKIGDGKVWVVPVEAAYRIRTDYRPGDAVPIILDAAAVGTIAVSDLLP